MAMRPYDDTTPTLSQYQREHLNNVHPPNWRKPTPAGRYNLVVIGAGRPDWWPRTERQDWARK